jgi:hypothetical protein
LQLLKHCKAATAILDENNQNWERTSVSKQNLQDSLACCHKFYKIIIKKKATKQTTREKFSV